MSKTAIFLITHDSPIETAYFLDNLIEKTKDDFSLYVYDYFSGNEDLKTVLQKAAKDSNGEYISITKTNPVGIYDSMTQNGISEVKPDGYSRTFIYNKMLKSLVADYGVFIDINYILNHNWLKDLKYYYKAIKKSGCVSIKPTFKDISLSVALFEDETQPEDTLKTIWVNQNNVMKSFMFFSRDNAQNIGGVDDNLQQTGLELAEWSFRFLGEGLTNYYITQNNVIKYPIENSILFPEVSEHAKNEFKEKINRIVKDKNYSR